MGDERIAQIKKQWAGAVGANPDDLDDWPAERIVMLEDLIFCGICNFAPACGECEKCRDVRAYLSSTNGGGDE